MRINRRHFLKFACIGSATVQFPLLAGCTHKKFFNPDEDIFISGGSYSSGEKKQNALVTVNLTQQEKRVIDTPFLPHETIIDPGNKYRLLCFEKEGENACSIDLQAMQVTEIYKTRNENRFSGHACFSQDGTKLYTIESGAPESQGSIVIRDAKTFKTINTLPSLGLKPHHCNLTDDNILMVSNTERSDTGFFQPAIISIDMNSEKLIERITLKDKNLNCGHFRSDENSTLVIASAPLSNSDSLTGGVSIKNQNADAITMTEPEAVIKRMTGEALSIEINNKHTIAAITHPEANLITFWSLKSKKILKAFGIEKPRGISQTFDGNNFVISYGNRPAMAKVSTKDQVPVADSIVQPTLATGEHMINWSKKLREIMPARIYG